ncbi:MAG: hypothetical protein ACFFAY_03610 [Promethearchaeota archaeon]
MRRKSLVVLLLTLSLGFNIGFFVLTSLFETLAPVWPFAELGPALVQDSYFGRAPALEAPFGMIGDVPGGYSLYAGNPLQADLSSNLTGWILGIEHVSLRPSLLAADILVAAVLTSFCPAFIIVIMGRKSFGSKKTQ